MDTINRTFTIQWVGPFHSYQKLKEYKKDDSTLSLDCFNFYYFEAKYRENANWKRYIGIHKQNDGVDKRLNSSHEHFGKYINYKHLNIWIGAFGNEADQTPDNAEIVETLYIRSLKDKLAENTRKKKYWPKESICVINLWYDVYDQVRRNRRNTIPFMDDVLVYDKEGYRLLVGKLSTIPLER